jgi:hypothetical protein
VLHVASARITGIFPLAAQQQPAAGSSRALLAAAAGGQALLPEAVSAFSDKVRIVTLEAVLVCSALLAEQQYGYCTFRG